VKHRLYEAGIRHLRVSETQRSTFRCAHRGQYEGEKLLYKEKVRFGFDEQKKREILASAATLRIPECLFANLPEKSRRGALDRKQMNEAVWVRPALRCTMEYIEKTEKGNIREHGRFGGLLGEASAECTTI
jgi:hypothetical protein